MLVPLLSLLVVSAPPAQGEPATATRTSAALHPSQLRMPSAAEASAGGDRLRSLGLVPRSDGGFTYRGVEGERFDAIIHADGTVEFEVDPSFQLKADGACVIFSCVTREMTTSAKQPGRQRADAVKKAIAQTLTTIGAGAAASLAGTPTATLVSPGLNYLTRPNVPQPISGFGAAARPVKGAVTGTVYGRYGYLPPPHAAMRGFLERTFEFRVELVKQADARRVAEQLSRLEPELAKAWSEAKTTAARHGLVLDAWDGIGAPTELHSDREVAAEAARELEGKRDDARARGREIILDFVHSRAPEGSADAFSPGELARYNAGRAAAERFEPYAPDERR